MANSARRAGAVAWEPVLAVLGVVGAVEDPGSFGPIAMEALADVVTFDSASYNEIDAASGRAFFCAFPRDLDIGVADVEGFPYLVRQNPILQYEEATGDGSARRISDFLSRDQLHALELYRRVYGPLGVEYQAAFALATKQPLVIAFALNRHDLDFTTGELAVLDLLRPHLIQAYRNAQSLAALRGIEGALEEVGRGIIVLGKSGLEDRLPPSVRRALREHFGPSREGALPAPVEEWLAQQRRRSFDDGQPRIHQPLVNVVGARQLVVRYIPASAERSEALVVDERQPSREVSELRRLGLTPREAEILLRVTHGEPTGGLARDLGVTPGTLNKHLQHIYRKLGVTGRTAATAAASDAIFTVR